MLSFEDNAVRTGHTGYFLPRVEERLQCHDWQPELLWSTSENEIRTHNDIRKITAGHGDDYTTGCSFDYAYLKENHKLIAIDLSKHFMLIQKRYSKLISHEI